MVRLLLAGEFLDQVILSHSVYFAGNVGRGKTAMAVIMSYLLERLGIVQHTVSVAPVAWAIPARLCPTANFTCILDEAGVAQGLDARQFASKENVELRRNLTAFLRKREIYLLISSKASPDIALRSLSCQRMFTFDRYGLPLDVFYWSIEEGKQNAQGYFGVWDRAWLWRKGRGHPSPKYGHEFQPSDFSDIFDLFRRSFADADKVPDVNDWGETSAYLSDCLRWFGLESQPSTDLVPQPKNGPGVQAVSVSGNSSGEGLAGLSVGLVSERNRAGRLDLPY